MKITLRKNMGIQKKRYGQKLQWKNHANEVDIGAKENCAYVHCPLYVLM